MKTSQHMLINGLSIGSGGGQTVARELWVNLAAERPDWTITLALVAGLASHEQFRAIRYPSNCRVLWAPPGAATWIRRSRYEQRELSRWMKLQDVTALLQLNGMLIPGVRVPTVAHFQDPWPYRPEAWESFRDRIIAWLKRREHAAALGHADCAGWTSRYLRDLICGRLKIEPRRSEIFYNGIPEEWLDRAGSGPSDWQVRPPLLVSVSSVAPINARIS